MKKIYITFLVSILLAGTAFSQATNNWSGLGPLVFPANDGWQINGIGRICQIKFHPTNGAKMYAISAKGGLWTSSDTANTWTKSGTDNLPFTMSASVCIDHTNDQILYLGTGDPDYYSPGYGVWKSTNGGATWQAANAGMGYKLVDEIVMSPVNANVLIAATNNGIYKTTDGGASWTLKKSGGEFTDMILKPNARTKTVYAATKTGFFVSQNMGDTWTEVVLPGSGISNGGRIGVTKADSNLVYLTYVGDDNLKTPILKSTNSGGSFTIVKAANTFNLNSYETTGISNGGQQNYNYDIGVDPVDPLRVYVVGHIFWTSTNGGASWTYNFDWAHEIHTDMHQIEVSPHNNSKLFNANDGGIWMSKNRGLSGTNVERNSGLATTECYNSAQSPVTKNHYYTGTQDNGGLYYTGTQWVTNIAGDEGSKMVMDYSSPGRVYYVNHHDENYTFNGSVFQYSNVLKRMNLPFNASNESELIFSPVSTNLAFISYTDGVYRCTDLNASTLSWTKLSLVEDVQAIALSPTSASVLYVLTSDNKMYRSDNATAATPTFTLLTLPSDALTNMTASISVVKSNTNIVYIACGQKVFRSPDKGVTWTAVSGGLLPVNILEILHDPFSSNESMYLATALGVYYKNSSMTNWLNYSKGLPTISNITDISIYSDGTSAGVLRTAFFGRGVWESPLYTTPAVNVSITSHPSIAYVAEGNITFTSTASSSSGTVNKVEYYNGTTLIGFATASPWSVTWANVTEGIYNITAKAYTTTAATGTSVGLQKITVMKLRLADNPSGTTNGVKFNHYTGTFNTVDLLETSPVVQSGVRSNFTISPRLQDDDFGFVFTGYVNVPTDGIYSFYTASDDGSVLSIGSEIIVGNDGYHGYEEKVARKGLKAGKHAIKVSYFEGGGDNTLDVSYEGPGIAKQLIPNSALYYVNTPITVALTSPAAGAVIVRPGNVTLTATATTAAGSAINKIEYYANTTLIATSTTSPFSATWTSPASGSYSITAKAFDNASNSLVSSPVAIVVDAAPTVSISSPANNANVASPVNLQVTVADADGTIASVEYLQGTTSIGVVTATPFSFSWSPTASGTYSMRAKATDNNGISTTSSVVTLNVTVGNTPPAVSLTSPANNTAFTAPATVSLAATASDVGGSIAKVEFFNGATLIQSVTTSPYTFSWTNVAAGTYTITAKATDNGNLSTTSTAATITVGSGNTAPTVSLTSPANNATFTAPASVSLAATASDPGGSISKVEFFNGATLIQSVTTSPYTFSWTNVAAGTYTITAKATDNGNLSTTSTAATITVTSTSTADIIGPDCGTSGSVIAFQVNTSKRANAVSYSWYYTGSGTVVSPPSTPYQATLTGTSPFQAGQICVGVNYNVSPWYASYCKSITACPVPKMMEQTEELGSEESMGKDKVFLYPNPVQNLLHVSIESMESSQVNLSVTDVLSKQIVERSYSLSKGKNQYDLDLTDLKEGQYTLTVMRGSDVLVKRITVKK